MLLTEVALRTTRIGLGTAVLDVWGRSAATLAMPATTLAEVSGGRFTLGLGAGSPPLAEVTRQAPDPDGSRALAAWWVGHYLTTMGPLYRDALRRAGHGVAVDAVLAANPGRGGTAVPACADVLLDELTLRGGPDASRAALDRWRAAGAVRPVLTLPPDLPLHELDDLLTSHAPTDEGISHDHSNR